MVEPWSPVIRVKPDRGWAAFASRKCFIGRRFFFCMSFLKNSSHVGLARYPSKTSRAPAGAPMTAMMARPGSLRRSLWIPCQGPYLSIRWIFTHLVRVPEVLPQCSRHIRTVDAALEPNNSSTEPHVSTIIEPPSQLTQTMDAFSVALVIPVVTAEDPDGTIPVEHDAPGSGGPGTGCVIA